MSGFQTVYHKGRGLMVNACVMEQLAFNAGQSITEAQMWKCIELNACALVAAAELRVAAGGQKSPDLLALEEELLELRVR